MTAPPLDLKDQALIETPDLSEDRLASAIICQLSALVDAGSGGYADNPARKKILESLIVTLADLSGLLGRNVRLTLGERIFFLGRKPIRLDLDSYDKAQQLRQHWSGPEIGELLFPRRTTLEDLNVFAGQLLAAIADPSQAPALFKQAWGGVTFHRLPEAASAGDSESAENQHVMRLYGALTFLVRDMVQRVLSRQEPDMLRLKRVLIAAIDLLKSHGGLLLSLANSPGTRSEPETHLLSTALLAALMGQRLGLPRNELLDLTLAALMHDLPKGSRSSMRVQPWPVPGEPAMVEPHYLSTLAHLRQIHGLDRHTLVRMVVLFESQLEFSRQDLYPDTATAPLCLHSRIISLCSLYNLLLWLQSGQESEVIQDVVIPLLEDKIRRLDPAMARIFLEVMGVYPTGATIQLNTGEVGIVISPRPKTPTRPVVLIVINTKGQRVRNTMADLSRARSRKIFRIVDSGALGINPVACYKIDSPETTSSAESAPPDEQR